MTGLRPRTLPRWPSRCRSRLNASANSWPSPSAIAVLEVLACAPGHPLAVRRRPRRTTSGCRRAPRSLRTAAAAAAPVPAGRFAQPASSAVQQAPAGGRPPAHAAARAGACARVDGQRQEPSTCRAPPLLSGRHAADRAVTDADPQLGSVRDFRDRSEYLEVAFASRTARPRSRVPGSPPARARSAGRARSQRGLLLGQQGQDRARARSRWTSRRPRRSIGPSGSASTGRLRSWSSSRAWVSDPAVQRAPAAVAHLPRPARSPRATSGTMRLPASVGVEQRRSATWSSSGVSGSWPMALTTGVPAAETARHSASSENGSRSSTLPPPRAITMTSTSGHASSLRQCVGGSPAPRQRALHGGVDHPEPHARASGRARWPARRAPRPTRAR